ncbi:hypothetical protein EDD66_10170 [Mobilisporobacter senegalensis]|uniref:Uncharacterized protein n=1 Tax=Mobilisporobacter senegalensis TaxID=1329262 RepID=A0A3N1XXY4_9FIRM|nr:hypothetical protein [Mobilisporobacter senegalensis]ROR31454.1 hypothetical protein EDD66_10170 [Mobilisporobacter senegalensis]
MHKGNGIYKIVVFIFIIIFTGALHVHAASPNQTIIQKFEAQTPKHLISIDEKMKYFYLKYVYDIRIYGYIEQSNANNEINKYKQKEINRIDTELQEYSKNLITKHEKKIGNKKKQLLRKIDQIIIQKQNEMYN